MEPETKDALVAKGLICRKVTFRITKAGLETLGNGRITQSRAFRRAMGIEHQLENEGTGREVLGDAGAK